MKERTKTHLKLIGLRLWSIPYFFLATIITVILGLFVFFTTIIIGPLLWIINGDPLYWFSWFPDNLKIPTIFEWEKFRDNVAEKQNKFNRGQTIFWD